MENPIKPTFKTEALPIALIVLSFAASFFFNANFPPLVPTHWSFSGQPNGFSSASFAAFFFPTFNLGLYLLMLAIPYLDPRGSRYAHFRPAYHNIKNGIILFLTLIYAFIGLQGLGIQVPLGFVPALLGALFVIVGNYMADIKSNWMIGIRNPWTLSSDEVWDKTHKLGSKVFMGGGVLIFVSAFLPAFWNFPLFLLLILLMVLIPTFYSYLLYSKHHRHHKL